jgi:hypothetical protein
MSRSRAHLSVVVDQVLAEANAASQRKSDESRAVKEAAAMPRTDLARDLRALADAVRNDPVDITYADLAGAL